MQDGAPSHLALSVPGWLDNHLPALWTGRREPTEWPKGSLDPFVVFCQIKSLPTKSKDT